MYQHESYITIYSGWSLACIEENIHRGKGYLIPVEGSGQELDGCMASWDSYRFTFKITICTPPSHALHDMFHHSKIKHTL